MDVCLCVYMRVCVWFFLGGDIYIHIYIYIRVRHSYILTENRVWSVPATLVEARVGDAWVSGRVQEGVLTSSEVFGDTRPFWIIDRRRPNIEQGRL